MNFQFLQECSITEEWMCTAYQKIGRELSDAEHLYWNDPQKCGIILRGAAEEICRVYNRYYDIGFKEGTGIEEFLCYTQDDEHNAMVSRFLSVVRKEQRDHLTKLRVLGDDCIWGEKEEHNPEFYNRMSGNAKRMMETMAAALAAMCGKINGRENIEGIHFDEALLPEPKKEETVEDPKKPSLFSKLFKKKTSSHVGGLYGNTFDEKQ